MNLKQRVLMLVMLFLVNGATTQAATLYMQPNNAEIRRGDTIAIAIRLDTDEALDECVNVVDATITYSENIEPVDTTRGNSILSLWLEEPIINKEDRTITFAGGIPNGYCGRIAGDPRLTNIVLELLFRSPGMLVGAVSDVDRATIDFAPETRALLNDGFGTDAPLTTYGATINLLKQVGNSISNEWSERISADTIPPEEFSILLERTPNAFSDQYYIVFNTTDKQSGIDHYEVMEEPLDEQSLFRWGAETAPWLTARSPYVLKDQTLNSTIRVRAVDKAGNEYMAVLVPDEAERSLSIQSQIMIALVVTVLVSFFAAGFMYVVFSRRRKKTYEQSENELFEPDENEVTLEASSQLDHEDVK